MEGALEDLGGDLDFLAAELGLDLQTQEPLLGGPGPAVGTAAVEEEAAGTDDEDGKEPAAEARHATKADKRKEKERKKARKEERRRKRQRPEDGEEEEEAPPSTGRRRKGDAAPEEDEAAAQEQRAAELAELAARRKRRLPDVLAREEDDSDLFRGASPSRPAGPLGFNTQEKAGLLGERDTDSAARLAALPDSDIDRLLLSQIESQQEMLVKDSGAAAGPRKLKRLRQGEPASAAPAPSFLAGLEDD